MKQIKGLKIFSIKEVVERSLDDLKVNEVCMLVFNIIMSCRMVAGSVLKNGRLNSDQAWLTEPLGRPV